MAPGTPPPGHHLGIRPRQTLQTTQHSRQVRRTHLPRHPLPHPPKSRRQNNNQEESIMGLLDFDLRTISITVIIALIVGAGAGYMVGNSPVSNLIEERDWLETEYDSLYLAFQDLEAELDSAQARARDMLRNPSMLEVHDFITTDKTDENVMTDEYMCRHIVIDFMKNAIEEGYLCYYVTIQFQGGGHAMAAFNTTDGGLVYVEPQTDDIVEPRVGQILDSDIFPDWGIIIDISLIP